MAFKPEPKSQAIFDGDSLQQDGYYRKGHGSEDNEVNLVLEIKE